MEQNWGLTEPRGAQLTCPAEAVSAGAGLTQLQAHQDAGQPEFGKKEKKREGRRLSGRQPGEPDRLGIGRRPCGRGKGTAERQTFH